MRINAIKILWKRSAFTKVELMVVIAAVAVLFGVYGPRFIRSKASTSRVGCSNVLKNIGLSFRVFATDNNDLFPMATPGTNGGSLEFKETGPMYHHFLVMSNEISTPKLLICPKDTRVAVTDFSQLTNNHQVSYFVGIDADETQPGMILSGDRNLHHGPLASNNILTLAPGSYFSWTSQMHTNSGNVVLGDGSVHQLSRSQLLSLLRKSSVTNRFALPE